MEVVTAVAAVGIWLMTRSLRMPPMKLLMILPMIVAVAAAAAWLRRNRSCRPRGS